MLPEWNDTLDMEAYRRCPDYCTGHPPFTAGDLRNLTRLRELEAALCRGLDETGKARYTAFRREAEDYIRRRSRYYFLRGYQAGLLDFPNWDWEDG